jgi:hypothetical protein
MTEWVTPLALSNLFRYRRVSAVLEESMGARLTR